MTAPIPAKPGSTARPPLRKGLGPSISAALILVGLTWWFSRGQRPDQADALASSTSGTLIEKAEDDAQNTTDPDVEKIALVTRREGVDASSFYKNAFVLYAALTPEEKDMLRQPASQLDPQKAAALFLKIQPIRDLLREAAEDADYCEWGLSELPPGTLPPQLTNARDLGRVATWSADLQFHLDALSDTDTEWPVKAFADLRAHAKFADNLSEALIGWLLQTAMEADASSIIRRHAMEFDDDSFAQAEEYVAASTLRANVARAFNTESSNAEKLAEKLTSQSPAERRRLLQSYGMLRDPSAVQPPAEIDPDAEGTQTNATPPDETQLAAWLLAEAQYTSKIGRQAAEALFWPAEQFNTWRAGVHADLEKHPMSVAYIKMVEEARRRLDQVQVEQAMLGAGLALAQSGPERLTVLPDPASGKPFTYVTKEGGFELQSTFVVRGKPLTMTFAPPR